MTIYPPYTLNSHRQSIEEAVERIEDCAGELQAVENEVLRLSLHIIRSDSKERNLFDHLKLTRGQRLKLGEFNTQEQWALENELDHQFKDQVQKCKSAERQADVRIRRATHLHAEIRQLQDEVRLKRAMESADLAGRDRMFVEISMSIMLRVRELHELQAKARIQELKIVQLQCEIAELEALQDQALQGA